VHRRSHHLEAARDLGALAAREHSPATRRWTCSMTDPAATITSQATPAIRRSRPGSVT